MSLSVYCQSALEASKNNMPALSELWQGVNQVLPRGADLQ